MFRIKNNRGVTVAKTKNLSPALPIQQPLKFVRKNVGISIKPTTPINNQFKVSNGVKVLNQTNVKGQINRKIKITDNKIPQKTNKQIQQKYAIKSSTVLNKTTKNKLVIKAKPKQNQIQKEPTKNVLNFIKQQKNNVQQQNSSIKQKKETFKQVGEINKQIEIQEVKNIVTNSMNDKEISSQHKKEKNKDIQQDKQKNVSNINNTKLRNFANQLSIQNQKQLINQKEIQERKRKKILQQEQDLKRREEQCRILAQKIKQRQRKRKQQKQAEEQKQKQRQKIQNQLHAGVLYSKDPLAHFQFSDLIMDAQINKILKTSFNHFPSGNSIEHLKQNLRRINQSYMATKYEPSQKKMNEGLNNYRIEIFNRIGQLIVSDNAQGYNQNNFSIIETDARGQKINDDVHLTRGIPQHKINTTLVTNVANYEIQCGICLQNIQINQQFYELSCHHGFHIHCCKDWVTNTANCPLCRKNLKL